MFMKGTYHEIYLELLQIAIKSGKIKAKITASQTS